MEKVDNGSIVGGDPYPEFSAYQDLYAKYLVGDRTAEMIELAGGVRNKLVVDICGGGGRLTDMVLTQGAAHVFYLDRSPEMAAPIIDKLEMTPQLQVMIGDVEDFLAGVHSGYVSPDVIFSQQAVNYWLTRKTADSLASWVKPGTIFCFNTFNKCPDSLPVPKSYVLDGARYLELSWAIQEGDDIMIEHIQIKEGVSSHKTRFRWISRMQFDELLAPHFEIEEHCEGATSIYVCRRKGELF